MLPEMMMMNTNFTPTAVNLHAVEHEQKVQDIIQRLDFIIKQKDMFQLQIGKEVKILPKIPTSSVVGSSVVYGREDDKEALMKLLFSDDADGECNISVIPIVGMGGDWKNHLSSICLQ
jgi:hypothetical protein